MTALAFATLAIAAVVYASLYPFEGWRRDSPGISDWLFAPWPRYWTGLDLWVNGLGYVPLGAVFVLVLARQGGGRWRAALAVGVASALSLILESVQSLMVHRVASNLDWALNSLGAAVGVVLMDGCLRSAWLQRWASWRQAHLSAGAGLVSLVLGVWLLLLPLPLFVPFAVGRLPPEWIDLFWRVFPADLGDKLGVPGALPMPWAQLDERIQVAVVALLLLTPTALLRFAWRQRLARVWAAWCLLACAVWVPTIAHVLTYGWTHAGDWLLPPVIWALVWVAALVPVLMVLPRVWVLVLLALGLPAQWLVVNLLAETGYWSMHWQAFAQGRFVRWYGLLGWLAVAWPLLATAVLLRIRSQNRP